MKPLKLLRLFACAFFTVLAYAAWTQHPCLVSSEDVAVEAGDAFVVWLHAANQAQPGTPDWSSWALAIAPENVLDTGNWTKRDADGIWLRRIRLIAFDTGQLTLPAMPLPLPPSSMCTLPSWNINVMHTINLDSAVVLAGIKDIHRTDEVSHGWYIYAALAALLLLTMAAGYALLRRKKPDSPQPESTMQPESVLVELNRLDLNQPTTPEHTAAFYARISYVMRLLIQSQTGLPALQTPVNDWVNSLPDRLIVQTQSLLEQCELAKFAKYQPPPNAHSIAVSTAKAIARQLLDTPKTEA
jgi:hypothetical protein